MSNTRTHTKVESMLIVGDISISNKETSQCLQWTNSYNTWTYICLL